jgi:hypothetical protein
MMKDRIEERKKIIGSRHVRKLRKYSDNFNTIFNFFLIINRKEIITFCGSQTIVHFDKNGKSAKECFRLYEDGYYRNREIITYQPNILKSVLISKKGWGLFVNEWSSGISESLFSLEEILSEFNGISIPKPLLEDFLNSIEKKKITRNDKLKENILNFSL